MHVQLCLGELPENSPLLCSICLHTIYIFPPCLWQLLRLGSSWKQTSTHKFTHSFADANASTRTNSDPLTCTRIDAYLQTHVETHNTRTREYAEMNIQVRMLAEMHTQTHANTYIHMYKVAYTHFRTNTHAHNQINTKNTQTHTHTNTPSTHKQKQTNNHTKHTHIQSNKHTHTIKRTNAQNTHTHLNTNPTQNQTQHPRNKQEHTPTNKHKGEQTQAYSLTDAPQIENWSAVPLGNLCSLFAGAKTCNTTSQLGLIFHPSRLPQWALWDGRANLAWADNNTLLDWPDYECWSSRTYQWSQ